eukprot:5984200-Amphidinium_carterae.1
MLNLRRHNSTLERATQDPLKIDHRCATHGKWQLERVTLSVKFLRRRFGFLPGVVASPANTTTKLSLKAIQQARTVKLLWFWSGPSLNQFSAAPGRITFRATFCTRRLKASKTRSIRKQRPVVTLPPEEVSSSQKASMNTVQTAQKSCRRTP